jgi:regulation of enolase protein 1 (concanavalin A-like superfamily)
MIPVEPARPPLNGVKISVLLFLLASVNCYAQPQSSFAIDGVPQKLSWINNPVKWRYEQKQLIILAGEKTDLFVDPQHEYTVVNSPKAVFRPDETFLLSAKAEVAFKTDYDAAVLVVYAGDDAWAKLCFEYSPQKKPYVVSVVNNVLSDDCNHVPVNGNKIFLRVAGLGNNIFAFHYSADGKYWKMVRYFSLTTKKELRVGFSSQSPTGKSCKTLFSQISYTKKKLKNLRNGE